jgi:hypothetical protein
MGWKSPKTRRQSRRWFPRLGWLDERNRAEGLDGDNRLARKPLRLGIWPLCEADHCMNMSQNGDVHGNLISKLQRTEDTGLRNGDSRTHLTLCGLCFGLEAERRRPPTLTAGGCVRAALVSLMGIVDNE